MSIQTLVKRYAAEAGIKKRVTPHSLRHAFATHMVVAGADIVHVQRMLGHADIGTTQIYTRIAPIDAQREHQRTHPAEQQQVPKDFMPVRKLKPDYVRRKRKGKAK